MPGSSEGSGDFNYEKIFGLEAAEYRRAHEETSALPWQLNIETNAYHVHKNPGKIDSFFGKKPLISLTSLLTVKLVKN